MSRAAITYLDHPDGADKGPVKLEFSTNGLCDLEAAIKKEGLGASVFDLLRRCQEAGDNARLSDLRLFVWGGLLEHQEGATLRFAGRVIDANGGVLPVMERAVAAFGAAMPDQDPADDAAADGAAAEK